MGGDHGDWVGANVGAAVSRRSQGTIHILEQHRLMSRRERTWTSGGASVGLMPARISLEASMT